MADPALTAPARTAAVRRVLVGILVANIAVVAVKFVVGLGIGSLAVVGDAVHSSVDAINNVFGIAVVRVASKGPDADHPYGHAKFETLGALLVVVFLSVSVFELLRGAWQRLAAGAPPIHVTGFEALLLGVTLAINVWVVWFETRAGRRLRSEILLADAAHTRVDVVITLAVISGLGLARLGHLSADPILAIVVSLLIIRVGWEIVGRSLPTLVDAAAVDAGVIRREAERVEGVRSAYAIRSRTASAMRFAELTIAVDGRQNVAEAHRIADAVEERLSHEFSIDHVQVHVEPC